MRPTLSVNTMPVLATHSPVPGSVNPLLVITIPSASRILKGFSVPLMVLESKTLRFGRTASLGCMLIAGLVDEGPEIRRNGGDRRRYLFGGVW